MDWRFVWLFCNALVALIEAGPVPKPLMGGEMGDLYGDNQMANHVPRLGRRSLNPFRPKHRSGFRFFSGLTDKTRSGAADRVRHRSKLAGFFGPLFNRYQNFRYYGGRPGEELARGLLRDKRLVGDAEEFPELMLASPDNVKLDKDVDSEAEEVAGSAGSGGINVSEDPEYWKNVLGEATINAVLEKMAEIGETRQMIEEFNQYEAFGVGNPLPKYLARYNHQLPQMLSSKIKVESSFPKGQGHPETGILNKYKSYLPFPRRKRIEAKPLN